MHGSRMPRLDTLTERRAVSGWTLTGLFAGLLFGFLLGRYTFEHSSLAVAGTSIAMGLWWGSVFGYMGYVGHACTGEGRDFSSEHLLVAIRCDLTAREETADGVRPESRGG
jgi:hypothetical protein